MDVLAPYTDTTDVAPKSAFATAAQGSDTRTPTDASVTIAKLASGVLDTDGTLAANSDSKIASQKATKTYADTKRPKVATLIMTPSGGTQQAGLPGADAVSTGGSISLTAGRWEFVPIKFDMDWTMTYASLYVATQQANSNVKLVICSLTSAGLPSAALYTKAWTSSGAGRKTDTGTLLTGTAGIYGLYVCSDTTGVVIRGGTVNRPWWPNVDISTGTDYIVSRMYGNGAYADATPAAPTAWTQSSAKQNEAIPLLRWTES
jgi:hypothetical protein